MKRTLLPMLLLFLTGWGYSQSLTPKQLYPGLFEAVQLRNILGDNKTFVDATPKREPALIVADYNRNKSRAGFNLKQFVLANFTLPSADDKVFRSNVNLGVRHHIDTLWTVLTRKHNAASKYSSLIELPNDFIIPGGRLRETYYWDSYFTMLGLHESHKTKIIQNTVDNFAFLIDKYGFIPTGTRTYYLTRSQAPFFSMLVDLLVKEKGKQVILKYQPQLLKEYAFWMKGAKSLKQAQADSRVVYLPGGEILNRYWDDSDKPREEAYKNDLDSVKHTKQEPAEFYRNIRAAGESGWDFGSRWFGAAGKYSTIETTSVIPVDLNCLLYHLELSIAQSYQLQGKQAEYSAFTSKANLRKKAILKYCWSEKDNWFMDYNFKLKHATPHQTIAGVFPLCFNIADNVQAVKMAGVIKTKFLKSRGLATSFMITGQQWDSPNAWAPMQFMAITGLQNYHQNNLAEEIAKRWINTNLAVFNATGKLTEKYILADDGKNKGGGEYPQQDGYGWTNGVLLYLLNHFKTN
ncbi:alpha,alpha-trehalase TreF [Mucilaginibacter sp.]|uniref:alpha,alpha-trehalase TreF n=1 Tax=Mucilaginibacter sp. TaxID=1882438 RepID=UPI0025D5727B|nr:alpha,alpha-trehalase TreF [Mucilaginibacter sp.]